ncbi:tectonic-3-like [Paramacrobiotus metropolitanus]|uniref:tectonic-3-like n=1 Tax=Paramacrobiotus metropolitanus TaxID=2943436 RepID=UPI002445C33E|nr:tectonic-3-like [Paramacrobiotus metropolitanus]
MVSPTAHAISWTNMCDTDCCCDSDCSNADLKYFTSCNENFPPGTSPYQSESCFASNWLMRNASSARTYYQTPSTLCLVYDNNPQRLFYSTSTNAVDVTAFNNAKRDTGNNANIISQSTGASEFQEIADLGSRTPLIYRSGDPVFILDGEDMGNLDKLRIPASTGFSTTCSALSTIKFMKDTDGACWRTFSDLSSECSSNPFLNISTYLKAVVITNPPEAFAMVNRSTGSFTPFRLDPSVLLTLYAPIQLMAIQRRDMDGTHQAFAFDPHQLEPFSPAYAADTDTCANAVTNVEYTIRHNASSITAAEVTVTLATINASDNGFAQSFRIRFSSVANLSGKTPIKRSGNPGYLDGTPVLVAYRNEQNTVILSTLKIPRFSASSECGDHGNDVVFGENVQMSCLLYVNISDPSEACQRLQSQIVDAMKVDSDWPFAVSGYGNATEYDVNQINWTPVQMVDETDATNTHTKFLAPNACKNIATGLSIEILYSKVGFLENPQPKITGLLYRLENVRDIKLEAPLYQTASRNGLISLEIQFSATFRDLTQEAVDLQKVQQPSYRLLPYDFLSPF